MPREIWVVSDGKAGHLNQSLGLAEALLRLRPEASLRVVPAQRGAAAVLHARPPGAGGATPHLLIGAGHGTHLSLLRWGAGAPKTIVLMRPSLPRRLFDLCIEPRHDGGAETERRWLSEGPLNRMRPAAERDGSGLLLIGGPSPHYDWDETALLAQVEAVVSGGGNWVLSTSRRTPASLLPRLRALSLEGLECHDAADLPADWLAERLPRVTRCWVTPDSASMVYEALTAGAALGLFSLAAKSGSRVAAGIGELTARGLCLDFARFEGGAVLLPPPVPLAEADRMAARIVDRGWL